MLDAVFCCLLWRSKAVVSAAMKVFEAAAPILQLIRLPGHDGLLLGHT